MNAILQKGSNHGEIKHRKLEIPKQVKFKHIDVSKFSNRKLFEANRVSKETANNLNDLIKHDILLARSTVYLTFFFGLNCIHTENNTNKEQNY